MLWLFLLGLGLIDACIFEQAKPSWDVIIGIKLGITSISASIYQKDGTTKIITDAQGDQAIPTYITFGDELLVGTASKNQSIISFEVGIKFLFNFLNQLGNYF
jgi:molecular chaperone DnaK (HSP70)